METEENRLCRLCWKTGSNEILEPVGGNIKKTLDELQLKLNFQIDDEQVLCRKCKESIKKCKLVSLDVVSLIVSLYNYDGNLKLDLKEVYLQHDKYVDANDIFRDQEICRFCLKLNKISSCKSLIELEGAMLQKCIPELNFNLTEANLICYPCLNSLKSYFLFIQRCVDTKEKIIKYCKFATVEDKQSMTEIKLDLDEFCCDIEENDIVKTEIFEYENEKLDMENMESDIKINVNGKVANVERNGESTKQLEEKEPENDLNIIREPVICADCQAALEKYSLFMMTVFIAEDKLEYMETIDISSKSEMELSTFLQVIIRDKLSEMNGNVGDIIQLEKMLCNDTENANEEVELKYDTSIDINDLISNNEQAFIPKNMLDCEIDRNEIDAFHIKETFCGEDGIEFKQELLVEVEDQKILHVEEVDIKADKLDSNRFEGDTMTQPKVVTTLNGKRESSLPNFEDSSEAVTMFKCYSCTYETKRKVLLNRHMLKHKNLSKAKIYKCDSCPYQTKKRYSFKRHLMNCKDPLEVMMHKCDSCSYQTRHKSCLSAHLLKHKDVSEVTMYKCDVCLYETKFKNNFNAHVRIHKKPSEVTMYKCDSCVFQSKYKNELKIHVMKHKDPSEVTMYVCDSCSYQTLYRNLIKIHLLRHKDPSEVPWFKCDSCSYRSIRKSHLKQHLLKHKDPSEVKMYKCDSCSYQSTRRCNFEAHLLKHKKFSEVTVYECDSCEFKTKYNRGLKIHLLTHKNPSEVKMYKCDSCVYQTRNKNYLQKHVVLKHTNFCEATTYKCHLCTFRTKHKYYLKTHMLRHTNPSEVKVNLEHS